MNLRVITPSEVVVDERVRKVTVTATDGSRTFLPRHIDFVTTLVPSVLFYMRPGDRRRSETAERPPGEEHFVAVDDGILTKVGDELLISTAYAVAGDELGSLRRLVEEEFRQRGDRERVARSALARLEASIVRRFMELGD